MNIEAKNDSAPASFDVADRRPRPAGKAATADSNTGQLPLMLVAAAGVLAGVLVVMVLTFTSRSEHPVATTAAAAVVVPAKTAPAETAFPVPSWIGERTARRASDGSKTISFELSASREVPVWMTKARPALVVRCLYQTTEAFVILDTSAGFEADTDRRTIRLQWDDGPVTSEQWVRSESGHELFAPGCVDFVKQLSQARHLRFGFTPFNAAPVTAEFAVTGFGELAGLVAGTCGWRLDAGAPLRTARLN